jgi:endoglucanase
MSKRLISGILLSFFAATAMAQNFEGRWYGEQYGSLLTVDFNKDSTVNFNSEAFSGLSFTSKYHTEKVGANYHIDIQMGKGLAQFEGNDKVDIGFFFGQGNSIQYPKTIQEVSAQPIGMNLQLYRRPEECHSSVERQLPIPAKAKLAFERNKRLGHGLCLNGVVDGNSGDSLLTAADIKSIADAGFQSVRLPICWVKHCSTKAPYTIDPEFFKKIDFIVNECLKDGLAVSIDEHYYPYINMSYPDDKLSWQENLDRLKSHWEQIAEHYKKYPKELYFDLLNEPNQKLGADGLNKLTAELLPIVRKSNPDRTVIVSTPDLGQHWTLGELQLPENDWNLIVQVHYYLPATFTHQALSYVPGMTNAKVAWNGTDAEEAPIRKDMDFCALWSQYHGRPICVGEFGACENGDQASRERYFKFMRQEFDAHQFSFHVWGYREVFRIYNGDTHQWNTGILKALQNK